MSQSYIIISVHKKVKESAILNVTLNMRTLCVKFRGQCGQLGETVNINEALAIAT